MTGPAFHTPGDIGETVAVTLNGAARRLPASQSLLAALLGIDSAPTFTCAIGQCQRCVVRVNGRPRLACMTYAAAGDEIETLPPDGP